MICMSSHVLESPGVLVSRTLTGMRETEIDTLAATRCQDQSGSGISFLSSCFTCYEYQGLGIRFLQTAFLQSDQVVHIAGDVHGLKPHLEGWSHPVKVLAQSFQVSGLGVGDCMNQSGRLFATEGVAPRQTLWNR